MSLAGIGNSLHEALVNAVPAWNLYGLPPLLALAIAGRIYRARGAEAGVGAGAGDRSACVSWVGWTHLVLAVWSLVRILDELRSYRQMEIFPSNPLTGFPGSLIAFVLDATVGLALLRRWRLGRGAAMTLALMRTILGVSVTAWSIQYGLGFDVSEWPHTAVTKVWPLFVFLVLALPSTKRYWAAAVLGDEADASVPGASLFRKALAFSAFAFFVVAVSVVAVDLAEFALRVLAESA